jgi:tRNA(Arg) A34 adenosine deaminase TadA
MTDIDAMRLAIAKCREGIAAGQTPFAAVIVRGDRLIAAAHNVVWRDTDPTAHAEITAIRLAAAVLHAIKLQNCTMYTTCEPCPMCLAAIHWARLDRVVYGATIADAEAAGFSELCLPAKELAARGGSRLIVEGGVCRAECVALFDEWKTAGKSAAY